MIMTAEHTTLQSARATAITESTNRTSIFFYSVSATTIALGLIAGVTHLDTAFYSFGLILLTALTLIGLATFDWVLQSGIEDLQYAERIARLRAGYLDMAPELGRYLASVPSPSQVAAHSLHGRRWRVFRSVSTMIGLFTAVLAGSAMGMLAALIFGRHLATGFVLDGLVTVTGLVAVLWVEHRAWGRASKQLQAGLLQEGGLDPEYLDGAARRSQPGSGGPG
jgi:hypothetical protein